MKAIKELLESAKGQFIHKSAIQKILDSDNDMTPKLIMVELYSGENEQWKGWHNLILETGKDAHKAIQGPIDPETSNQIKAALNIGDI